ncbi:serine/threonine-protein kinase [Nannocystis radixulma]|uniref:Serine/threonine-protein kinase n=1 Tax=Nannocystis radixulma TaxID=2995305 RepID=A0ABT5B0L6_9BACT|nr:serine/threonine-protein kinase [Nannocystis radixulma]MDC0667633.1 serine/threonine-protein kinase [Nannocystis radixulma]
MSQGFCPMDGNPLADESSGRTAQDWRPPARPPESAPVEAVAESRSPARTVLALRPPVGPGPQGQVQKASNGVAGLIQAAPAVAVAADKDTGGAFFPAGGLSRPKSEAVRVAPPEEALVGRVLDQRYRIEEPIGFGGMGVVYKARHVIIDKPLAIKLLRQEHAAQADIIKRFLLEAQVASRVKHPNIVDISDYGQIPGGTAYYAMEYLTGETLAARIDRGGRLEPQLALEIAVQILHGLQAAHAGKIIHRDLKSENIFLCDGPEGGVQIKILDFGIARVRDKKTRLTANGALIGTPAYMSPEQAQGQDADERSDLYAFGVILFEMLTGRVPFKLPTVAMVLSAQIFDTPPGLREVEPAAPDVPNIERFIRLLLAKNRDERAQTAAEAISLLKAAAELDASLNGSSRGRRPTVTLGSWGVAEGNAPTSARGETPVPSAPADSEEGGDAATTRAVSPSGRIERRPSVIVQHGTHVERIAAPPTRAQTGETLRPPITGVVPGPRPASSGPPTLLIVAAAASIGAALTVTLYKQYYRKPAPVPAPATAPAVVQQPPTRVNLTFESDPPGAKVLRDGVEELGVTPFVFAVDPQGPLRRYVFRLADHQDTATEVAPGKSHEKVRVVMRPLLPPAPPPPSPVEPGPAAVPPTPTPNPTSPPADAKVGSKPPRGNAKVPAPSKTPASETTPAPQPEQKPVPETDESDIGELKNPFPKKD